MNSTLSSAIGSIAEVVMFENWLRFYFIAEEGEKLVMRLPDKAMEQIKKRYSRFYDLAEMLNNEEISHAASIKAVCLFVAGGVNGKDMSDDLIAAVFDSPAFHLEMQLFGSWVQAHEELLDREFKEFADWQHLFSQWKETEEAKSYRTKLAEQMPIPGANATQTIQ